ncbi:MAG TPA: lysylphosphatidylglycerol synthase domain-containing protein [Bacteroidota bacterium]|nr:lysylphosphatidylglycerol synthase domain-containing protein [Bacteroidota bacterium]
MNEPIRRLALRVLPAIAGIAVICMLFRGIDWHAVAAVVQGIGSGFAIIASIYLFGCIFDTLGWREVLQQTDRRIGFWRLLGIHIAGEAYYRFIPAGVVVGEGVKSILARKQFGIKYSHVVSSLLLRKLFMGIAQMLYVGGAVAVGLFTFSDGPAGLLVTAGGMLVVGLLLLFGFIGYGMWKGKLSTSLLSQLSKLPSYRLRQALEAHSQSFIETDALLVQALRRRKWTLVIGGAENIPIHINLAGEAA